MKKHKISLSLEKKEYVMFLNIFLQYLYAKTHIKKYSNTDAI